jgi:hypothetical protein
MRNTLTVALVAAFLALSHHSAGAQDLPRFEAGGQVTPLHLREFGTVLGRRSEVGIGGRFTVNLTRAIAAEGEVDVFPSDQFVEDRRKLQGLFGIKAGVRKDRVGVFGKVRPGFMRISDPLFCAIPEGCPTPFMSTLAMCATIEDCPALTAPFDSRTWFALDAGGVFEFYPSSRFLIRADAGDTFIRFKRGTDVVGQAFYYSSHNLQIGIGAAVRF